MTKLRPGKLFNIGLINLENISIASTQAKSSILSSFPVFSETFHSRAEHCGASNLPVTANKFALFDFQLRLKQDVFCISHDTLFPVVR